MKLHTYWRSTAAWRVRIALNIKGLTFESVTHHLARGEQQHASYLATNPQGLLPALEVEEDVLTQSLAIIEYLEERWPDPPLLPRAAIDRAVVRAMAQAVACDIHPLNNLRVLTYLRGPMGQADAAVDGWYVHWIAAGFAPLEELVARHAGGGRHCFGDVAGLADLCLVPQLYNARRFNCGLAAYPRLRAIGEYLETLPEFANAHPDLQPDAPAKP